MTNHSRKTALPIGRTIAGVTIAGLVATTSVLLLVDLPRQTVAMILFAIAVTAAAVLWYTLSRYVAALERRSDDAAEGESRERELAQLVAVLEAARHGDLTTRATATTSLLVPAVDATNTLLDELADRIGRVAAGADDLTRSASELERSANASAVTVERQAAELAEVGRRIGALSARCDEIGQIVEVLDDLARQTNVLALNAALEASRAGPQGRGFATVADEVRKLAERSAAATRDVGAFTQSMQGSAADAGRAVDDLVTSTRSLVEHAVQTTATVGTLIDTTKQVAAEVAPFRALGPEETELLRALRGLGPELARALDALAPLARDADSPLAQAVQRLRSAAQAAANASSAAMPAVDSSAASPAPEAIVELATSTTATKPSRAATS